MRATIEASTPGEDGTSLLTKEELGCAIEGLLDASGTGDAKARRDLLGLAIDLIREGRLLPNALSVWLVDGLTQLHAALEPGSDGLQGALQAMGRSRAGRPPKSLSDGGARGRERPDDVAVAAAVELLVRSGSGKAEAVECVAEAIPTDPSDVWRACSETGFSDPEDLHHLGAWAEPVLERLRKTQDIVPSDRVRSNDESSGHRQQPQRVQHGKRRIATTPRVNRR